MNYFLYLIYIYGSFSFLVAAAYYVGRKMGEEQGREHLRKVVYPYICNCSLKAHETAKALLRPRT